MVGYRQPHTSSRRCADVLIEQISDGLRLAFGQIAGAPHRYGVAGLRRVLQTGIGALVPILESTAGRQLLTYEITTTALRRRDTGDFDGGQIADRQYEWPSRMRFGHEFEFEPYGLVADVISGNFATCGFVARLTAWPPQSASIPWYFFRPHDAGRGRCRSPARTDERHARETQMPGVVGAQQIRADCPPVPFEPRPDR